MDLRWTTVAQMQEQFFPVVVLMWSSGWPPSWLSYCSQPSVTTSHHFKGAGVFSASSLSPSNLNLACSSTCRPMAQRDMSWPGTIPGLPCNWPAVWEDVLLVTVYNFIIIVKVPFEVGPLHTICWQGSENYKTDTVRFRLNLTIQSSAFL